MPRVSVNDLKQICPLFMLEPLSCVLWSTLTSLFDVSFHNHRSCGHPFTRFFLLICTCPQSRRRAPYVCKRAQQDRHLCTHTRTYTQTHHYPWSHYPFLCVGKRTTYLNKLALHVRTKAPYVHNSTWPNQSFVLTACLPKRTKSIPETAPKWQLISTVYATPLMTPTTDLGLSICLSVFELRETGDRDIFLGPPERARAETGGADQWVLKRSEC